VKRMPGSVTSVFGDPDEFQTALRPYGVINLLVAGSGQFRARLTQVTLHHLHLLACDEQLPRIAFITVPTDTVLVALPINGQPAPFWGGMEMQAGEIFTLGLAVT
jgi:hypothetical protein